MGRLGLLPVLPHADVPEGRLALQLGSLHQHRDAAGVGDDLARRALQPGAVFLEKSWEEEVGSLIENPEALRWLVVKYVNLLMGVP